jgi:hypothetical protein
LHLRTIFTTKIWILIELKAFNDSAAAKDFAAELLPGVIDA